MAHNSRNEFSEKLEGFITHIYRLSIIIVLVIIAALSLYVTVFYLLKTESKAANSYYGPCIAYPPITPKGNMSNYVAQADCSPKSSVSVSTGPFSLTNLSDGSQSCYKYPPQTPAPSNPSEAEYNSNCTKLPYGWCYGFTGPNGENTYGESYKYFRCVYPVSAASIKVTNTPTPNIVKGVTPTGANGMGVSAGTLTTPTPANNAPTDCTLQNGMCIGTNTAISCSKTFITNECQGANSLCCIEAPVTPEPTIVRSSTEMTFKKVMIINIDPIIKSKGNIPLHEVIREGRSDLGGNDPLIMANKYIADMKRVSGNYVNYSIVGFKTIDTFPVQCEQNDCKIGKKFTFTEDEFLKCLDASAKQNNNDINTYCHNPNTIDMQKILADYQVCEARNNDTIDELWLFSRFWLGIYEAASTGPLKYRLNGGPNYDNTTCTKILPIMGFSYERGTEEMLHDSGHRFETTMAYFYGRWLNGYGTVNNGNLDYNDANDWEKYAYKFNSRGIPSGCGVVHDKVNSDVEYGYTVTNTWKSNCDNWYDFPPLKNNPKTINCTDWGCNEQGFQIFWLGHIPQKQGTIQVGNRTLFTNWWKYYSINY
ncbi:hypothetical protein HGA88_04045 [Candidatus Roizmanbacteria bacterium]|nr:hypothetical protein [Candidatus Roizmanbacteria bacterium]